MDMKKFLISLAAVVAAFGASAQNDLTFIECSKKAKTSFAIFTDNITYEKCQQELHDYRNVLEAEGLATYIIAADWTSPDQIKKIIGDITAADIKKQLNYWMTEGYAYTTVKKVYVLLNEYFRYLYQQEIIVRNPMANVEMIKKANFMSAQGKENLPPTDTIEVFSEEEIEKFKAEAFSAFGNGKRKYQQVAAYVLMLNTGLRTGEALGLLNSDVDLDNRVMHVQRGVKEVSKRDGVTAESGREVTVGKLKSATSKRDVPLNDTAIEMIKDLRREFYFGEDSPLIPDEYGEVTRPVNFRKRFYRILKAAGIETKGLHGLRHTFATRLINGTKDKNGNIKSLTPRQVADLLGHTTSEITELYYVKRDMKMLNGITDGFEL